MKEIQGFISTGIINAKSFASFFLLSLDENNFAAVKINEAVGKRIWKVSKIRYVVGNEYM